MAEVIPMAHYLVLAALVFAIGIVGVVINRRNVMILLVCVELMLLAGNMTFVVFSKYLGNLTGEVFVFFVLAVAAVESAIALAIIVVLYRQRGTIEVDALDQLKG